MDSEVNAAGRSQFQPTTDNHSESVFQELLMLVSTALSVSRERRALRTLSDEALADIGIERRAALEESRRSLLDLPASRL